MADQLSGGLNQFALDHFSKRARERLFQTVEPQFTDLKQLPEHGDHRLNAGREVLTLFERGDVRLAAVLIALVEKGDESMVIFTQRSERLANHAGQVAFPGGKLDPQDESLVITALREAEEEIGLGRRYVERLGIVAPYQSANGFRIIPVVGRVEPGAALRPDQNEVSDIFEVPLSHLMDADNYQTTSLMWKGAQRYFLTVQYRDRKIWGITAGICRALCAQVMQR